jgi:DNA-binding transcriptional LysR family regulator
MELRDLKTFASVARLLSFNRAGEALHAAQSTVSARIAGLEDELGVRLFDRLGRKVALTEAGVRLLDYAAKMLDLEDEARAFVAGEGEAQGALTVRIPESLAACRLGGVVRQYRERFPRVRLEFTTCSYDGLAQDLRRGVTDLAFLLADSIQAGDLRVEMLGAERLVLAAGPGHRLAGRGPLEPGDLAGEPLVLSRTDCAYRRMFEALLAEAGVRTGTGVELSSVAGLKACLAAGVGVSILPEAAVREDVAAGRLAVLPWAGGELETGVLMVRHRDKWLSPALAGFMDLARAGLVEG